MQTKAYDRVTCPSDILLIKFGVNGAYTYTLHLNELLLNMVLPLLRLVEVADLRRYFYKVIYAYEERGTGASHQPSPSTNQLTLN